MRRPHTISSLQCNNDGMVLGWVGVGHSSEGAKGRESMGLKHGCQLLQCWLGASTTHNPRTDETNKIGGEPVS